MFLTGWQENSTITWKKILALYRVLLYTYALALFILCNLIFPISSVYGDLNRTKKSCKFFRVSTCSITFRKPQGIFTTFDLIFLGNPYCLFISLSNPYNWQ